MKASKVIGFKKLSFPIPIRTTGLSRKWDKTAVRHSPKWWHQNKPLSFSPASVLQVQLCCGRQSNLCVWSQIFVILVGQHRSWQVPEGPGWGPSFLWLADPKVGLWGFPNRAFLREFLFTPFQGVSCLKCFLGSRLTLELGSLIDIYTRGPLSLPLGVCATWA